MTTADSKCATCARRHVREQFIREEDVRRAIIHIAARRTDSMAARQRGELRMPNAVAAGEDPDAGLFALIMRRKTHRDTVQL